MKIRQGVFLVWLIPVLLLSGCAAGQPQVGALETALTECESDIRIVDNSIDLRITNNESEQDSAACISNALDFDWDALATRFNSGDESFVVSERDLELRASRADDKTVVFSITETSVSEKTSAEDAVGLTLFLLGFIGVGLVIGFFLSRGSNYVSGGTLGGLSVFGILSLGFPVLLSSITDSDPAFWSEFNSWGGPTYGGLIIVAKAFTGFLVAAGFASIVLLIVRWRKLGSFSFHSSSERENDRRTEFMQDLFPDGVRETLQKALRQLDKAVSQGDVAKESHIVNVAVQKYLVPVRERNILSQDSVLQEVKEEFEAIQQKVWNSHLSASIDFEWLWPVKDLQDKWLEFGREEDDIEFWVDDEETLLIQVRGQRLILGSHLYLLDHKTQIRKEINKAEFEERYEVFGEDWKLSMVLYHDSSFEDAFEERRRKKELGGLRESISNLLDSIGQIQATLKMIDDQAAAEQQAQETQTKYLGKEVGEWSLIKRLGGGAFGSVWLGERTVIGAEQPKQKAAVKIFSDSGFQSSKQFQAEMVSLAQLDHPNIAKLLGYATTGNQFWFATSFAGEMSLGQFVAKVKKLNTNALYTYAVQLFAALAHAHRRDVIHGDIHPGNLVMTNDQSAIVLVDFGLSTVGSSRTQLALTNLAFRAPELLSKNPVVSDKNDVYSAAITIATVALGRLPWKSTEESGILGEVIDGNPDLTALDPNLAIFLKPLLNKNPSMRPSSNQIFLHLKDQGFSSW
jgi:hypothetical protein